MIKNIVFDLDGTLWQTRDSYIYAYRKLCEKYHKTPLNGFSEVLKYMGVKVDVLLKDLFPEIIDQRELIREALLFSIEFYHKGSDRHDKRLGNQTRQRKNATFHRVDEKLQNHTRQHSE